MNRGDRAACAFVLYGRKRGEGESPGAAVLGRPVGTGLGIVAGEGGVEGGRQQGGDHMRLPAHQDLGGWGVGERGGGREQSRRGRVGAVDLGVVGRGWEERKVERVRGNWAMVGWAGGGAGEALALGER